MAQTKRRGCWGHCWWQLPFKRQKLSY